MGFFSGRTHVWLIRAFDLCTFSRNPHRKQDFGSKFLLNVKRKNRPEMLINFRDFQRKDGELKDILARISRWSCSHGAASPCSCGSARSALEYLAACAAFTPRHSGAATTGRAGAITGAAITLALRIRWCCSHGAASPCSCWFRAERAEIFGGLRRVHAPAQRGGYNDLCACLLYTSPSPRD